MEVKLKNRQGLLELAPTMNLLLVLFAFYFLGVAFQLPFVRWTALVLLLFVSWVLYIEGEARYHRRCLRYHEEE